VARAQSLSKKRRNEIARIAAAAKAKGLLARADEVIE
jgi:hypothetical protein